MNLDGLYLMRVNGKGLLARYLHGSEVGGEDFVFKDEIDFMEDS